MVFKPGESGNPGGRKKEKAFADALRLEVNRTDDTDPEKRKKLTVLAEKLVKFAYAGEGWAFQHIADRLDGKPAQALENGDDGPLQILVRKFVEEA